MTCPATWAGSSSGAWMMGSAWSRAVGSPSSVTCWASPAPGPVARSRRRGAGEGGAGGHVQVDDDAGERGDGLAEGGGGGQVAQAIQDKRLPWCPPGVIKDQAGEGAPAGAGQLHAELLEDAAAGGQTACGSDGPDRVAVPVSCPAEPLGQEGGDGGLAGPDRPGDGEDSRVHAGHSSISWWLDRVSCTQPRRSFFGNACAARRRTWVTSTKVA
jgi:hypothetical protein